MPYIPNEKQAEAHAAVEQFVGYGGAMGGGKTRFICEMAKILSAKFPGNFGLVARQSGPALAVSTMEVFFSETLIPGSDDWNVLGCKFNKAEGVLYFTALNPPSKIWFTGLDRDNLERIKSLNLGFFCLDEATEITESVFMMLCTRLRRKHVPKMYRKAIISANPEAGWVKRRFLDLELPNHRFIQANYKDNPHLPDDYPELFTTMPKTWREKYLEGNWGAVTGLIYKEFDRDFHIIPYRRLPPEWRLIRGLDHGQQNPTAVLSAGIGYTDNVYLREMLGDERMERMDPEFDDYPVIIFDKMYYEPGLVSKHRQAIAHIWPEFPGPTYADPSIWRRDRAKMINDGGKIREVEYTIADEYLEHPYPVKGLLKANNNVEAGINRISQLMLIGHIFFMDHDSMEEFIGEGGEIHSYSWKHPRTDDDDWPEEPDKKRDHACDAARYAVMSMPPLKVVGPKVVPYNSFMAARQRAIAAKRNKKRLTIAGGKLIGG